MNKYWSIACAVGFVISLFLVYDYGNTKGYDEAKATFDSQISEIQKDALSYKERIKSLEASLALSAEEYEELRSSSQSVFKENEKWKSQVKESKNQSLSLPTVQRLNSLLE